MANSVDPDQTAPIGAVCSGSTLFASILTFGNYLQQTNSADNIFRCIFFLGALRVKFEKMAKTIKNDTAHLVVCRCLLLVYDNIITLCMLGNFSSSDFFFKLIFQKFISGTLSECLSVLICI